MGKSSRQSIGSFACHLPKQLFGSVETRGRRIRRQA